MIGDNIKKKRQEVGLTQKELAEKLNCKLYMYPEEKYGHNVCDEAPDFKQRVMDFFHSLNK